MLSSPRGGGHTRVVDPSSDEGLLWVRPLLRLARAGARGTLTFESHGREARMALSEGRVVGFEGDLGPRLGILLGIGSDRFGSSRRSPIGEAALADGRITAGALRAAVRRQARERAAELASWRGVVLRWSDGEPVLRAEAVSICPCDLVAEALRRVAGERLRSVEGTVTKETGGLSRLGAWWARRAALHPAELAAVLGDDSPRANHAFASAARDAGLFQARVAPEVRDLVRLHLEVRRAGLRGLYTGSDDRGRRKAVRRWVAAVHPDRFDSDPALRRVSHELVTSLLCL